MAKNDSINNMIPLVEDYYFTADENQYILYRCGKRDKIDIKTKRPTGEIIDFADTVGFYTTLSSMLKSCVVACNRRKVQNGEIGSLKDCVEQMNNMYERIESLTKEF